MMTIAITGDSRSEQIRSEFQEIIGSTHHRYNFQSVLIASLQECRIFLVSLRFFFWLIQQLENSVIRFSHPSVAILLKPSVKYGDTLVVKAIYIMQSIVKSIHRK